jgi:hypothetical protein
MEQTEFFIIINAKTAVYGPQPSLEDSARFVYAWEFDHPVFTSLDFTTIIFFLRIMFVSLASNPQFGGPDFCIYVPQ